MTDFFKGIPAIKYEGEASTNEFAFRHYNPDEVLLGKRMEDHLRFALPTGIPLHGRAVTLLVARLLNDRGSATQWRWPN